MAPQDDMAIELTRVGRVIAAFGLVTAFGHVSRRTSPMSFEITALGDLASLGPSDVIRVGVDDDALPAGAPGEAWLHAEIYRSRREVDGIVRAQPASAFAVAAVAGEPAELDEADIEAWTAAAPPLLDRLWQAMALRAGKI